MPPSPPKAWERYLPNETFATDHHLLPIICGLVGWFRGEGRAMLRTVRAFPFRCSPASNLGRARVQACTRSHVVIGEWCGTGVGKQQDAERCVQLPRAAQMPSGWPCVGDFRTPTGSGPLPWHRRVRGAFCGQVHFQHETGFLPAPLPCLSSSVLLFFTPTHSSLQDRARGPCNAAASA